MIVVVTTAIALGVTSLFLMAADIRANRVIWGQDLATQAAMLELITAPSLAVDDRQGAARSLAALEANRAISVAAIYGPDGR